MGSFGLLARRGTRLLPPARLLYRTRALPSNQNEPLTKVKQSQRFVRSRRETTTTRYKAFHQRTLLRNSNERQPFPWWIVPGSAPRYPTAAPNLWLASLRAPGPRADNPPGTGRCRTL